MHPTAFHVGVTETILFKEWNISNWQGMLGSAIVITLFAALFEALKYCREYVHSIYAKSCEYKYTKIKPTMLSVPHVIQTLLFTIQMLVSYFLMLIFMTYNVYLCLSITIGALISYFLLFWNRKGVVIEIEYDNTKSKIKT